MCHNTPLVRDKPLRSAWICETRLLNCVLYFKVAIQYFPWNILFPEPNKICSVWLVAAGLSLWRDFRLGTLYLYEPLCHNYVFIVHVAKHKTL